MSAVSFADKEQTLKYAMQMEKDGMEFYAEAAKNSSQALGRNLFLSLIEDEKKHYEWLEGLLKGESEPGGDTETSEAKDRFENIFTEASKEAGGEVAGTESDLAAVDRAMDMERKGFRFYKQAASGAPNAAVKQLCERIAEWENTHYSLLQNTRRYLEDPRDWFTWEEGAMLDGGGAFA